MNLGFIGTGLMGRPMAARLLAAGHELTVWNRTPAKADTLVAQGAKLVDDPATVFAFSDATVTMLTDGDAVASVLEGASLAERTLIQMSTIAPAASQQLAEQVTAAGGEYLEAPVLGSIPEAEEGRLLVMVGARAPAFDRWHEVLTTFGPAPRHVGRIGQAATLKLALNQLIASQTAAFAYSLGLVQRGGLLTETFMEVLRESPLYAAQFDKKLPRLLDGNFADPNFPLRHLQKDVALCLQAGGVLGLGREALLGVQAVIDRAVGQGLGDGDYAGLHDAVNPRD